MFYLKIIVLNHCSVHFVVEEKSYSDVILQHTILCMQVLYSITCTFVLWVASSFSLFYSMTGSSYLQVTEEIQETRFNTGISAMMEFINAAYKVFLKCLKCL